MDIREEGTRPANSMIRPPTVKVKFVSSPALNLTPERVDRADQVLVGRNNTRRPLQHAMRQKRTSRIPCRWAGRQAWSCLRKQPPKKKVPVQRRAGGGESRAPSHSKIENHHHGVGGCRRTKISGKSKSDKSLGPRRLFWLAAPSRTIPWEHSAAPMTRFRPTLRASRVHKIAEASAMGRRCVLFDESFAFQDSRARKNGLPTYNRPITRKRRNGFSVVV